MATPYAVDYFFRATTRRAASATAFTDNPQASINLSRSRPVGQKKSRMPTRSSGTGQVSIKDSATALPKPPMMLCSSAVTIAPVSDRSLEQDIVIQRFERVHFQQARLDALRGQDFGSSQASPGHGTHCDDGQVASLPERTAFPDLQRGARLMDRQRACPADPQINGTVVLRDLRYPVRGLGGIRRDDHGHPGQGADVGEVGDGVMRGSILEIGNAGITGGDLDVGAGIAHAGADLFERSRERMEAKPLINGMNPPSARPAATSTMLGSAMPTLKNRSGYRAAKKLERVEAEVSTSNATSFWFKAP